MLRRYDGRRPSSGAFERGLLMISKLDRLLEMIAPERTLDAAGTLADQALNCFRQQEGIITSWEAFADCLGRFRRHLDAALLHLREPVEVPIAYSWQRCVASLCNLYGRNGEKAAFEMARTGADGGLYAVLKAVAQNVADEYASRWISTQVLHLWNSLSVDEQFAAASEYLRKYGHLLPSELTEGSAARIRANFHRVLEEHPRTLRRLHRVGR